MLAAAQVVQSVATRLGTVVLSGGRVYTNRNHPLTEADLPAWRVYMDAEDVTGAELAGVNEHIGIVNAEGYVRDVTAADDAMNALASQGCAAVFATTSAFGFQLQGIDREPTREGESATALVRLRVAARYFVAPSDPETILSS